MESVALCAQGFWVPPLAPNELGMVEPKPRVLLLHSGFKADLEALHFDLPQHGLLPPQVRDQEVSFGIEFQSYSGQSVLVREHLQECLTEM